MTKQKVLTLYAELKDIRNHMEKSFLERLFSVPHREHRDVYAEIKEHLYRNEEILLDILFDDTIPAMDRYELVFTIPGHGGSVTKEDNPLFNSLFPFIWNRRDELPFEILVYVEWLESAHQYDTNQS